MDVSFVQVALIFVVTFIAAIDQFDFLESSVASWLLSSLALSTWTLTLQLLLLSRSRSSVSTA